MSKTIEKGALWPGVISVIPYTNKYGAVYRSYSEVFDSYKEAEEWIKEKQWEELSYAL